jgi:hypothetical protein
METIAIKKQNAVQAYKCADAKGKELLKNLLGVKFVTEEKVTEVVKTFEDACEVLGLDPEEVLPEVAGLDADDNKAITAVTKLIIIARALNQGWVPDWKNSNEPKWHPYFNMESGSGLSFVDCGDWFSGSDVGSRLCFKTRELAEYAAKQFTDIYQNFFCL